LVRFARSVWHDGAASTHDPSRHLAAARQSRRTRGKANIPSVRPVTGWFMSTRPKVALAALRDMAYHIDLAAHFIQGFTGEEFRDDLCTVYAVTRCLEMISEASRRLPAEMKARHPSIACKDIAGASNVYRHDYEDVLAQHVWGIPCASICRRCAPPSTANRRTSETVRRPNLRFRVRRLVRQRSSAGGAAGPRRGSAAFDRIRRRCDQAAAAAPTRSAPA
jgi:uncharacterized protein with HEPN domain